jgi:hypothetical protein
VLNSLRFDGKPIHFSFTPKNGPPLYWSGVALACVFPRSISDFFFGSKVPPADASAKLARKGHCTAVVKVTDDLSQLLWGHSSWFHYANMHRVYKHYHLGLPGRKKQGTC